MILLLEEDFLLAMDIEDRLVRQGFDVLGPFSLASEAMEAARTARISGAVIELSLGGEFSFTIIDILRARAIPLIICSDETDVFETGGRLDGLPLMAKTWPPLKMSRLTNEIFGQAPNRWDTVF